MKIILTVLIALVIGYGCGTWQLNATHAAIDAQTVAIFAEFKTACETAQMTADEYYGKWLLAESNVTTLTISLGTAIDAITAEGYAVAISDEGTVTISKPKPKPEPAPQVSRSTPTRTVPSGKEYWSESKVRATLQAAAEHYGVDDWIVEKGCGIAYRESTYNARAVNGSHVGLFQFNADWESSAEKRMDGTWSCYRFVKAYADGGAANIKKHWTTY